MWIVIFLRWKRTFWKYLQKWFNLFYILIKKEFMYFFFTKIFLESSNYSNIISKRHAIPIALCYSNIFGKTYYFLRVNLRLHLICVQGTGLITIFLYSYYVTTTSIICSTVRSSGRALSMINMYTRVIIID